MCALVNKISSYIKTMDRYKMCKFVAKNSIIKKINQLKNIVDATPKN